MYTRGMNVTQARNETHRILREHGLYQDGWRFDLGRGKRTLGTCYHGRKLIRISKFHIWHGTDEEVMNTILHEIAHALVGKGHGHDRVWRAKAREIGLRNPTRVTSTSWDVQHRIEIECPEHGVIAKRHRKIGPERLIRTYCKKCGSKSQGKLTQVIYA